MRSIRQFVYAAVLGVSLFAVQPTPAAAEEAHGSFTLSHEVHWEGVVLRPGNYFFTVKYFGAADFLLLRRTDGTGPDAMLMAKEVETPEPNRSSSLLLVSRGGQSFVSTMELKAMKLRFEVPSETPSK